MRVVMLVLLGLLLGGALVVLCSSPHGYAAQDRNAIATPATGQHLAGTDELGRDRAVRVSLALLLGMAGACSASFVASSFALLLGGSAALCPERVGSLILYAGDLFLTLPWIFLLMLVRAALPLTMAPVKSGILTFLLLALLGIPAFLRVTYERTRSLLGAGWMLQARAGGLRPFQIAQQALPHLRPLFWLQFLLYVPACVIAEANLGALGLGISEPVPSWGTMLASLQSAALVTNSHLIYLPMTILVAVLVALELLIFGARA